MRKFMTTFVLGITLICGTQSSYAHVAATPDQDIPPTAEEWDEGADASHSAPVGETNYGIGRYPKSVAFLGTIYNPGVAVFVNQYCGPINVSKTISSSVAATFNATTSIGTGELSAGIGFSLTSTYSVSDTFSKNIPAGECWKVTAYPTFQKYSFEIWDHNYLSPDIKVGSGLAYKPIGLYIYPVRVR